MSSNLQLSVQSMIALYEHIDHGDNVFWVTSLDYNQPHFISNNFESIWGITPQTICANPKIWYDKLAPASKLNKDRQDFIAQLTDRDTDVMTLEYVISDANNQEKLISDTSFKLFDASGNPVAFAGIAKLIPDHLVSTQREIDYKREIHQSLSQQLTPLLQQDFNLTPVSPKINDESIFNVQVDNRKIQLTKREAECLYYFFKGLSSKKIAQVLDISHRTVELYFDRIRQKVCCHSRIELYSKISDHQMIDAWNFSYTK